MLEHEQDVIDEARFLDIKELPVGLEEFVVLTLVDHAFAEDLHKLSEIYEDGVWKPLESLDEAAAGKEATSMNVSICWAEYDSVP